jgi:Secretion system C-terminal sorting domain
LKDCPAVIPCDSVKLGFVPNTVTICLGDSVMLNPITNPVTGLTYLWIPSTGLSSATIKNPWAKPLVTTTYNLIVSVPNSNCKKDGSMTVIVKPCNICRGASAILGAYTTPAVAGAMYSWTSTPASTIVNGNTASPTVTPLVSPTVYTVTISVPNTDGTVCKKTATVTVYWKDCQIPVGTRVAADENTDEITVAPNPTQSVISVQIPDSFNWKSATLINQQGVILNEQDRTDDAKSVKFDVQKQPSGMYIIRVKTDKGFVNKKVIKE